MKKLFFIDLLFPGRFHGLEMASESIHEKRMEQESRKKEKASLTRILEQRRAMPKE
jgi:hypothetical protein